MRLNLLNFKKFRLQRNIQLNIQITINSPRNLQLRKSDFAFIQIIMISVKDTFDTIIFI